MIPQGGARIGSRAAATAPLRKTNPLYGKTNPRHENFCITTWLALPNTTAIAAFLYSYIYDTNPTAPPSPPHLGLPPPTPRA